MNIKFVNSEKCEIDGKSMVFMSDPFRLFSKINDAVQKLGGEKFYSSTDPEIKKVRESIAEVFFLLAIKKFTGHDWFLVQPEDEFPDFFAVSIRDGQNPIEIQKFELTEIPPRCENFEQAMEIVSRKLLKGYPAMYCSLLIFINNSNSINWVPLIHENLNAQKVFKEIWSLHLVNQNGNTEFDEVYINRLSPNPVRGVGIDINNPDVWIQKAVPSFARLKSVDGQNFFELDSAFIKELRKFIRATKNGK